jgi:HSP20 family molecular chaperone IbpA
LACSMAYSLNVKSTWFHLMLRNPNQILMAFHPDVIWRGSQEVMATGDWAPRVDIAETDKEFVIKAEK